MEKTRKIIFFFILIFSINVNSQKKTDHNVFVMVDSLQDQKLFIFEKNNSNSFAKIKVLYFSKKKEGFKNKDQANDTVFVNAEPNSINYYEFTSTGPPERKSDLTNLKVHKIIDISQHKVWNSIYPHTIIFIEKLTGNKYNLWKMRPLMHE